MSHQNNSHRPEAESVWQYCWFRPISSAGFGLMRLGFGVIGFVTFLLQWSDVMKFYTSAGLLPHNLVDQMVRSAWRFSLLDALSPTLVFLLYLVLLVALVLITVGLYTRIALIVGVLLMYSFHEYALITLDGGDTLLRLIGFILMLSPCTQSITVTNLWKRMELVRTTGKDQPAHERTMSVWPYRLLLWQMIIMYVASSVEKFTGSTWREGSAVAITLHHGDFSRLPTALADALAGFSPAIGWFTILTQLAWILLLFIPILIWIRVLPQASQSVLKRALLLSGVLIHGAIFLLMDVGTFSLTVFVAYLGLLLSEDFSAIRKLLNRNFGASTIVLFDGRCGLCRRSVVVLKSLDWLHRLEFANFREKERKEKHAKHISMEVLDASMHIRLSNGEYEKGFFAFRSVSWHLPSLWILMPFLYIPGVPFIGDRIYATIAKNRPRCESDTCTL